ncbi:ABC transporter ATP-binding protein [Runella slithyformis]|uniref:Xenobiotic-transporting ATPase n=1 Tax=Runella slithyformis (strain ATCC 29530 / DSM 19594 / LMG 11500 / NCIMB 11436 / LSU 4) TaxID=761193 RepID=A0A7U4E8M3_RUNSL|nr:ABC transporter transmembrane domain-containing protein [Runella slithyformis]AEI51858.1 Xenobiotic-transporting ATPase [Runella slithyformis DSM 19594]
MAKGRGMGVELSPEDKKRKLSKESVSKALKIFRFILPYKSTFLVGILFLLLSLTTNLIFPKLIGEIVAVIEGKSSYKLNQVVLFLIGILILQSLFSFGRIYFFSIVSEKGMADIRRTLYSKIVSLPIPFFEQRRVGELMSRITSDVQALQDVLSFTLAELFRSLATVVVGIVIICFISWKLTIFMLATFPVAIVVAMIFGRYIRKLSKKAQDELANANVVVEETLQSVTIVKAFTNEFLEVNRYGDALARVIDASLKAARFRGGFVSFIIFALFGGIVGVVWYGATLVQSGEMPFSELMTFIFYTMFIGGSIGGLGDMYAQIQKTLGASERLLEILEEQSEVDVKANVQPITVSGNIAFENVRFSYPTRPDMTVLKGVSLEVPAGRKIALVGYSGAGKSTIVQLLMRYHTPQGGTVSVDGQDIQSFDITAYRQNIAVVPQEVILFGGTIRENIAYGKPNATQEEVREAARKANALDFIESFPDKLETVVGERGIKLSGGQRQRIAIARAILKDPKILILDEATSSLDAESEKLVQEALDRLMQNRTTIIIAHRLATVRNVDCIYVIKDGTIFESGTHEELALNENGLYAGLIKLQFEAVEHN